MNAIEPYFIPGLDETQVPESSGQLKIHVVSPVGGGEGSQSSTPVLSQLAQPMLAPISRTISFSPPLRNATSHEEVEELINLEKVFYLKCLRLRVFPESDRRFEMEFDSPTWLALIDNFLPMEERIFFARSVLTVSVLVFQILKLKRSKQK